MLWYLPNLQSNLLSHFINLCPLNFNWILFKLLTMMSSSLTDSLPIKACLQGWIWLLENKVARTPSYTNSQPFFPLQCLWFTSINSTIDSEYMIFVQKWSCNKLGLECNKFCKTRGGNKCYNAENEKEKCYVAG